MPKCQSRVWDGLRKALAAFKRTENAELPTAIFWLIPDTDLWGAHEPSLRPDQRHSGDAQGRLGLVTGSRRHCSPASGARTGIASSSARHLLDAGFSRVFLGPYQPKQECFEVVLIPGVFGAATYQWAVPSADRYNVPLGFVTQSGAKLQKLVEFTRAVLASSLHGSGRGNGSTPEDRRFWFNDAIVSDFSFLDRYVTAPRNPAG